MTDGDQVRVRQLPDGGPYEAVICSVEGRVIELAIAESGTPKLNPGTIAADLQLGAPTELDATETLCLGVVERRQGERLWIAVEHLLDRKVLASIQATWKE